jgi:hypothetical protein
MAGALVTVYLAKGEIIPEFRPIFDISEMHKERSELQEKNKKTAKEIDNAQAKILKNPPSDEAKNLNDYIEKSQKELATDTKRLEGLERKIMWSQVFHKGVGFAVYIFLGGVIGSLLADWVEIEGVSGTLPRVLIALVVGASWTSYLSAIGLKSVSKKTDENIQANQKEASRTIAELKKKVEQLTKQLVKKPEKFSKSSDKSTGLLPGVSPASISEMAENFIQELDEADLELQEHFDFTRREVQRSLKGIL